MATNYWIDGGDDGDWENDDNWSLGAEPVDGDDVFIEQSNRNIILNLGQSAIQLASLNISMNFTGTIGTLATPLRIDASVVNIGYNRGSTQGQGSGRIHIDFGDATKVVGNIFNSRSAATDPGQQPVRIKADKDDSEIYIIGGRVGLCDQPGESGEWAIIDVSGGVVVVGHPAVPAALTVAALNINGGLTTNYNTITNIIGNGGTLIHENGAVTLIEARGATITSNSGGTIAAIDGFGGTVDMTQSQQPRTITALNLEDRNFAIQYNPDIVTVTTITNNITGNVNLRLN
jgi:hypothetical protein